MVIIECYILMIFLCSLPAAVGPVAELAVGLAVVVEEQRFDESEYDHPTKI